jgi:hypothetical protein
MNYGHVVAHVLEHQYSLYMDTLVRDLDAEMAGVAGHLNVQHAHAVALIAEALDRNEWVGHGIASPEHWVKLRLGVSHPRARTLVAVARHYSEFPATIAEFTTGGLSLEQVEVVVTRAPAWADVRMADFAGALTVPQLRRVIRDEYFDSTDAPSPDEPADDDTAADAPAEDAADQPAPAVVPGITPDRFAYDWVGGRLVGSFDIAADRATAIVAIFDRVRDELFRTTGTPASNAETFSELVARAGSAPAGLLSFEWGNGSRLADTLGRLRTFLHLDITGDGHRLLAQLSGGIALPDALTQYLTCDGCVTPVWERDFVPVGYGRDVRIVPVKLRRLIERRDRGCRVPGCGAKHIEVHHIIHWLNGGDTETWNLVSLCARHHRLHHQGLLTIRGNPDDRDGLEFFDSFGEPIRGPSFLKPDGPPPEPPKQYEPPSGEHMDLRWFSGWSYRHLQNTERIRQAWNKRHEN